MNPKIILGSIVYNEEHRFLEQYLLNIQKYADEIVLIDDGSTDNSLQMCKEVTKNIFKTNRLFTKNEVELRDILWSKCCDLCNDGDFILIQDCDELLHEDDAEYLRLRRLVYEQKNGEAIATRTLELAKDDFTTNTDAYNASTDKLSYVTSFAKDTIQKRYSELNADGLRKEFETQLQRTEQTNANIKMNAFASGDRSAKVDVLVNEAGFDRNRASGMTEVDLGQAYAKYLQDAAKSSMTAKITLYNNSSADRRVEIATDQATQNVSYEVSGMSSAQLDSKFTALNAERIEVTYGNSFGNIQSDAAKAEGDAKNAQAGLDDYIKTKGKKVKDIDSAFAIADNRYKAKKAEEKRRQQQQQNQNNNNNNGGTP